MSAENEPRGPAPRPGELHPGQTRPEERARPGAPPPFPGRAGAQPPAAGPRTGSAEPDTDDEGAKKKKKKKDKKDRLGSARGIETMFRTSYRTHIDMSSLADSKANIMISINGLIMSILIASISPGIDSNPWLLLPTSVLLLGCLVSMTFAVLAARPRVTNREVSLEDVRSDRANILFFGNFVNMDEADYTLGMTELLQHPDALYRNMIRDIYSLGRVLAQKFHYLRISYVAFMISLIVGVSFFLLVLLTVVARTGATI